jgi:hypothetical protein
VHTSRDSPLQTCWRSWNEGVCKEHFHGGFARHLRCIAPNCTARPTHEFLRTIGAVELADAYCADVCNAYLWAHPRLKECTNTACRALLLTAPPLPTTSAAAAVHAIACTDDGQAAMASSSAADAASSVPALPSALQRSLSAAPATTLRCALCVRERCHNEACPFPAHHPAPCRALKWWVDDGGFIELEEGSQEALVQRLDLLTSLPCPRCKRRFQKGPACDTMHCPCGHNWSWISQVRRFLVHAMPLVAPRSSHAL